MLFSILSKYLRKNTFMKINQAFNYRLQLTFLFFLCLFSPSQAQKMHAEEWLTKFEKSNYLETPRYNETIEYYRKLEKYSPFVKSGSFGTSPQGRDLRYFIISKDKAFTPEKAKRIKKPVLFCINGIHSGEIEGKDSWMLLLREMLVTKEHFRFLDSVIIIVVPIFNVDGHERFSKYNRINQNGPKEMGWRTTAQNLNLNRDWLKADAPEMQGLLRLFSAWLPDFFIDSHTTDGADHQYHVTYGLDKFSTIYSETTLEVSEHLIPLLHSRVPEKGFLIAPYVGFKDNNPKNGLIDWPPTPRFSNGYTSVQNRIGLLIETHVLKPYKERVFATKAVLETILEYINKNASRLLSLNQRADYNSALSLSSGQSALPVSFKVTNSSTQFLYKGFEAVEESSQVSGTKKLVYTRTPYEAEIPYFNQAEVTDSIKLPFAYIIPQEYKIIAERLQLHGVVIETTDEMKYAVVNKYKFNNVKFASSSYEGRQTVSVTYDVVKDTIIIPKGAFLVKTNQRTVRVIGHALEPKSGDSFLRWGFMNGIFERKEYFEDYIMEKVAVTMLEENPALREEFFKKVESDEKFRNDPYARLNFLYERSPYFDQKFNIYPIMRIEKSDDFLKLQ